MLNARTLCRRVEHRTLISARQFDAQRADSVPTIGAAPEATRRRASRTAPETTRRRASRAAPERKRLADEHWPRNARRASAAAGTCRVPRGGGPEFDVERSAVFAGSMVNVRIEACGIVRVATSRSTLNPEAVRGTTRRSAATSLRGGARPQRRWKWRRSFFTPTVGLPFASSAGR